MISIVTREVVHRSVETKNDLKDYATLNTTPNVNLKLPNVNSKKTVVKALVFEVGKAV